MEFNVQTFIDQVVNEEYDRQSVAVDEQQLNQEAIKQGIKYVAEHTGQQHLAQSEWKVSLADDSDPVSVRLETAVINLPLENAKTISKILNVDDTVEVNVYLVCESPDRNRSGLRIDRLASVVAVQDDADSVVEAAQSWIDEQLAAVRQNRSADSADE